WRLGLRSRRRPQPRLTRQDGWADAPGHDSRTPGALLGAERGLHRRNRDGARRRRRTDARSSPAVAAVVPGGGPARVELCHRADATGSAWRGREGPTPVPARLSPPDRVRPWRGHRRRRTPLAPREPREATKRHAPVADWR